MDILALLCMTDYSKISSLDSGVWSYLLILSRKVSKLGRPLLARCWLYYGVALGRSIPVDFWPPGKGIGLLDSPLTPGGDLTSRCQNPRPII